MLIITVDDMSADSIGGFACKLAGPSPNVVGLAKEGLRFWHARVQVGNGMPSRNCMSSGRYPHNNRVEGFYQMEGPGIRSWPICRRSSPAKRIWTKIHHPRIMPSRAAVLDWVFDK